LKNKIRNLAKNNGKIELALRKLYYRFPYRYKSSIAGKNNKFVFKGNLRKCKIDIVGDNNLIEICEGAFISDNTIYIRGNNHHLKIGKNCRLKHTEFWFEDFECAILIGDKTSIQSAHLAATEPHSKIILGEDCMLSTNIEIRTGDSHSIIDLASNKRINIAKDVVLADHVWVGAKATLLKGVTIGHDSIIGTGSIVTNMIPPNTIASGIPAKVIKENITWARERI
jgi:acetyltransferase-like isoleucine patch superfamily enzyme